MIEIPRNHARESFEIAEVKARVVTQTLLARVALDVGFIDHVQAVLVAQIEKAWIVWIMRCAHCIKAVLLHQQHVFAHDFFRHGFAMHWMVIVAIHAIDQHALAIDQEVASLDVDAAKTDEHCTGFYNSAVRRN